MLINSCRYFQRCTKIHAILLKNNFQLNIIHTKNDSVVWYYENIWLDLESNQGPLHLYAGPLPMSRYPCRLISKGHAYSPN